jgi:hypothetical protein
VLVLNKTALAELRFTGAVNATRMRGSVFTS